MSETLHPIYGLKETIGDRVLENGRIFIERDPTFPSISKCKIGDGTTPYPDLPYIKNAQETDNETVKKILSNNVDPVYLKNRLEFENSKEVSIIHEAERSLIISALDFYIKDMHQYSKTLQSIDELKKTEERLVKTYLEHRKPPKSFLDKIKTYIFDNGK